MFELVIFPFRWSDTICFHLQVSGEESTDQFACDDLDKIIQDLENFGLNVTEQSIQTDRVPTEIAQASRAKNSSLHAATHQASNLTLSYRCAMA